MKIIVLGSCGRMGSMHAQHLIEMQQEVFGVDIKNRASTAEYPYHVTLGECPWWEIKEVALADGIVIATPADQHCIQLVQAIAAGLHVFVEKPICLVHGSSHVRKALAAAKEQNLVVAVGYNLRFHPQVMAVKDKITSGALRPMWGSFLLRQKPQRPIGNFLEEWASHEVDLAMHLLGPISGWDDLYNDRNKNLLRMSIVHELPSGPVSFIHADAVTEPSRRAFTIVDQDGASVTCDIESDHVQEAHYKRELAAWLDEIWHQKALRTPGAKLVGDGGPLASGEDGLAVIELLERISR